MTVLNDDALSAYYGPDRLEAIYYGNEALKETWRNYSNYPVGSLTTPWAYQNGTGQVTSATTLINDGTGPFGRPFLRRTVTTPKTTGSSGWYYREAAGLGPTSAVDMSWFMSVWMRTSVNSQVRASMNFRLGATNATAIATTTPVLLPANTWVEVPWQATSVSGPFDSIQYWPVQDSLIILPAGATHDISCAQFTPGLNRTPYRDGDWPEWRWEAAARASKSYGW